MTNTIQQGVDCYIDALNLVDITTGLPLDVTGFTVTGVARSTRPWPGPIIATWNTTPAGTDGVALAGGAITDRVRLVVGAAQTMSWWWRCAEVTIQADMTDPATDLTSRIIDARFFVSPDASSQQYLGFAVGYGYECGYGWGWEASAYYS